MFLSQTPADAPNAIVAVIATFFAARASCELPRRGCLSPTPRGAGMVVVVGGHWFARQIRCAMIEAGAVILRRKPALRGDLHSAIGLRLQDPDWEASTSVFPSARASPSIPCSSPRLDSEQ